MNFWKACADLIRRRHILVLALAAAATVALALGIPRLEFKTSQDTIVPAGSQTYRDNVRYERQFGGEPVLVLFTADDIRTLFQPPNVGELATLEQELNDSGLYHSVFGPLSLLSFAQEQIPVAAELAPGALAWQQERAAEDARAAAAAAGATEAAQELAAQEASQQAVDAFAERNAADATRLAAAGEQSLDNPAFVEFLIFDEAGAIRPEFEGIFPDAQHALMVVRLNGNMTIDEQGEAAETAVDMVNARSFQGLEVLPTGPPILLKEINDTMRESMMIMGVLASVIMAVVLFLVFRARWRLLSLAVVVVGSVWAFGLMGYLGISLTMVTISGLPILIGLGMDFAIQMHSRFEEETERTGNPVAGLESALRHLAPALAIAVLAATVGFLALHISRVPMIRDFGSMLAVGIIILAVAGVIIPASVLYMRDRNRNPAPEATPPRRMEVERLVRALTSSADGRLLPVVALGVAFIFIGLLADRQIDVQTDPERFVPQDSPVLRDLYTIRDTAGSSSQMGIMVEAGDVTDQETLDWIGEFGKKQVEQHPAELMRVESVATIVERIIGGPPTAQDVEAVLAIAPESVTNTFISDDRKSAHIIFAIGAISLGERRELLDEMEVDLAAPPGITATPSGLAVIGIEAVDALSANRGLMIYVALGGVLVWLAISYRNLVKTVLPILPVLIAVGGSSAAIYLLRIELNPLTAVSGPLIIATCTEFSVLIMARYFEERERGSSPREAVNVASLRIGRAITASGLTTIGGFGVLAFSGLPLLQTFGVVTALNVGIALFSTLIVLPPLLVWADEGTRLVAAREDLRPVE
ncbi:MAG: hydrophobe/amphiphile efflux-3 (HAE3) family transporter [Dehalococcoidia bacterium]